MEFYAKEADGMQANAAQPANAQGIAAKDYAHIIHFQHARMEDAPLMKTTLIYQKLIALDAERNGLEAIAAGMMGKNHMRIQA